MTRVTYVGLENILDQVVAKPLLSPTTMSHGLIVHTKNLCDAGHLDSNATNALKNINKISNIKIFIVSEKGETKQGNGECSIGHKAVKRPNRTRFCSQDPSIL